MAIGFIKWLNFLFFYFNQKNLVQEILLSFWKALCFTPFTINQSSRNSCGKEWLEWATSPQELYYQCWLTYKLIHCAINTSPWKSVTKKFIFFWSAVRGSGLKVQAQGIMDLRTMDRRPLITPSLLPLSVVSGNNFMF